VRILLAPLQSKLSIRAEGGERIPQMSDLLLVKMSETCESLDGPVADIQEKVESGSYTRLS
jgi:hypothetical protein